MSESVFTILFLSHIFITLDSEVKRIAAIVKKENWIIVRQTGIYMIMRHEFKKNQVNVPFHGSKEVKIGALRSILKDADIKINKR